jgi:branched-chain amino acid transport system ATP-binding protein
LSGSGIDPVGGLAPASGTPGASGDAGKGASAAAQAPLLELGGLDVHYGAIHALHGVAFRVAEGEIVTLIGANGAGKTTTLRAISGMLKPSAGTITYRGKSIAGQKPHELVARGLCHAPEGRGIFSNLTVRENFLIGAFLRRDKAQIEEDCAKGFALFPLLKEREKQMAGTLSGGEQQMLAIARALMARPKLLLLDEPSLGLAPQVTETIFRIIGEINRAGVTILLVEQNAHLALGIADHGYVLETGCVVQSGTGAALLRSPEIRKAYLGE